MAGNIPGMGGASLEVNRNYNYRAPSNMNSVRTRMDTRQRFETEQAANTYNQGLQRQLGNKRRINTGQKPNFDAFLKLLTEQLKHQDPLKPMEDKDFIAQMAQFSSLGEMVKFNKSMTKLLKNNQRNFQYNLLGKRAYWYKKVGNSRETRSGIVNAVSLNDGNYEIQVGNRSIPVAQIFRVEVVRENNNNNRPNVNNQNVTRNTNQRPVNRTNINRNRNIVVPSELGMQAETHNRINSALNNHVVNE